MTVLDVVAVALRHQAKALEVVFFPKSRQIVGCARVRPQECSVKMVTNGVRNQKSDPGQLREGIGEKSFP